MVVLRDVPGAYERAVALADDLARRLGVQKEVIYGFMNERGGHLPQSLDELVQWGNTPDPVYGYRRRQPNGVWQPLMPGPTPGKTDQERGGFNHVIGNAVDSQLEPFLKVNDDGTLYGGSWDPAYNAAHPELGRFRNAFEQFAAGGIGAAPAGADTAPGRRAQAVVPMGGGRYQTVNGPKTMDEMQAELRKAGYGGPWDEGAITAAYERTSNPGGGGGSGGGGGGGNGPGGLGPLIDAAGYANTQEFDLKKRQAEAQMADAAERLKLAQSAEQRAIAQQDYNQAAADAARYDQLREAELRRSQDQGQFEQKDWRQNQQYQQGRFDTRLGNERNLWSNLAQNLLAAQVQLGSRPEDYFKYQQSLAGGKDIFSQLFGQGGTPAYSAPVGEGVKPGNIGNLVAALGMTGVPGGWSTGGGGGGVPGMGGPGGAMGADEMEQRWMDQRGEDRPYTPRPDLPFMPPVSNPLTTGNRAASLINQAYQRISQARGGAAVRPDDPELIAAIGTQTGLNAQEARRIAQLGHDYYAANQQVIPENVLAGHIAEAINRQRVPNPDADRARGLEEDYWRESGRRGGAGIPTNDPWLIGAIQNRAGVDRGRAGDIAQWGHDYTAGTGYAPTGQDLVGIIERTRRQRRPGGQSGAPPFEYPSPSSGEQGGRGRRYAEMAF